MYYKQHFLEVKNDIIIIKLIDIKSTNDIIIIFEE